MFGTEQMKVFCVFLQYLKLQVILLGILLFSAFTNGELLPSNFLRIRDDHLVRCLTHISQRYFVQGRSLVISSPDTYRDMQQELIAEIRRNSLSPVVVTVDGNISKQNKTDFMDRSGSFIILIPDGDIKYFNSEFLGLILDIKIKFTRIWNSEALLMLE